MASSLGRGEEVVAELRATLEEDKDPGDDSFVVPALYLLAIGQKPR